MPHVQSEAIRRMPPLAMWAESQYTGMPDGSQFSATVKFPSETFQTRVAAPATDTNDTAAASAAQDPNLFMHNLL